MPASGIIADGNSNGSEWSVNDIAEITPFEHGGFALGLGNRTADAIRSRNKIAIKVITVFFIQITDTDAGMIGFCHPNGPVRCFLTPIIGIFPHFLTCHIAASGSFGQDNKIRFGKFADEAFYILICLLDSLYIVIEFQCKYPHHVSSQSQIYRFWFSAFNALDPLFLTDLCTRRCLRCRRPGRRGRAGERRRA